MKKKIFSLLWIVLASAPLAAAAPVDIEKAIKPGVNLANFSGKVLGVDWKIGAGFSGGFSLSICLTDFFAIQPEFFYAQKNPVYKEPYEKGNIRHTMRLTYLELPLLARISIPLGAEAAFRPYFLGGMSFGLKAGSKLVIDYVNEFDLVTPIKEDRVEGLKSANFNFVLGAGVDFAVKGGRILVEGRYSRPISSISTEGLNINLNVISVLVGYIF